jgi:formylglycine-generating enzyme required for sulfatase activity
MAFSGKKDGKQPIAEMIAEMKYSAAPVSKAMMRITVRGRSFDIDRYEFPNRDGSLPRGGMTFEDADLACGSAGKRLCTDEEWTAACRSKNLRKYSYSGKFGKNICHSLHQEHQVSASGAFTECKTADGIYDMNGNLWEWVTPSPTTGALRAKGGSFRDGELAQRCVFVFKLFKPQEKYLSFDNFGARCCKDVSP